MHNPEPDMTTDGGLQDVIADINTTTSPLLPTPVFTLSGDGISGVFNHATALGSFAQPNPGVGLQLYQNCVASEGLGTVSSIIVEL